MSRLSRRQHKRGERIRWDQQLWAARKPSYGDKVLAALAKMTDEEKAAIDKLDYAARVEWFNKLVPPDETPEQAGIIS